MRAATEKFTSEMDALGKFVADACVVDDKAEAGSSVRLAAFVEWASRPAVTHGTHRRTGMWRLGASCSLPSWSRA